VWKKEGEERKRKKIRSKEEFTMGLSSSTMPVKCGISE
jgi:hypothetical protein